ncbi:cytosine permease [Ornithinimicrobium pekingense]|uniref:Purine-cytosine permease n=1 Tax=Ornithinimicrobium pekingense TaxID=384677 RepID=A0ABQ2F8H2_9MICO|nr:cytosine permease [Ornithinimicrobium pekingense]GGK69052.1 purine-cytosine permease [Ornithinimicrobium pekingense]
MTRATGEEQVAELQPGAVDPDYPVDPVPRHARKSTFSLAVVLVGFTMFTPTMLAGAQIGAGYAFLPLMGVLLLGSLVLGVYVSALGWLGASTNLTTAMMARNTFGRRGAKLSSLLLGGTQIGWYGVSVATLALLTGQALGWESEGAVRWLMLGSGLLMGITAYIGYRGMYVLSLVALPLMLILGAWVAWRAFDEVGGLGGMLQIRPESSMGMAMAVTLIVGTFASGGTQAPNWTRFARTPVAGFWTCIAAFLGAQLLMLFSGAIGALAFGEGDFVVVLFNLGLVVWGLLFLVANIWTTNDNTAYNVGVAGAELFDVRTRKPFVVAGVVIGTLLAVTGIYDSLITYLVWLGILIPPLGGVILGDHLARRAEWRDGVSMTVASVRWDNVAVYAAACLVAWAANEVGFFIPPVIGMVVALLGALVLGNVRRAPIATR